MPSMAVMTGGCATGKVFLSLYSPSSISIFFLSRSTFRRPSLQPKVYLRFNPILCFSTAVTAPAREESAQNLRYSLLIDRLRIRHLKEGSKGSLHDPTKPVAVDMQRNKKKKDEKESTVVSCFEDLGLKEEVLGAIREMGISVPTEIQAIGVPAVLQRKNVVLGSHTGSGKTLAYMLPLVQLLKHDEELSGVLMKPRRPRAVVLCPTRELTEQVFRVAKSISHHARFRSILISGGGRSRPQEDLLKVPFDVVVGTPGRILQHIEDGNLVYGDIKYLVLDEADTMFDKGFGPDIRKFLGPLRNRAAKPGGQGFQTVLVTATMTKAVQKLIDNEFEGILHLKTSTLHKKIASARHDFIKLSGAENKLESLQQVLKPSLTKGNRVMVFCNTLNSSRAVDHFLTENQFYTVNYHGEVPAEERAENLKQFKCNEGDCPTLVCTDLAARGLDLDVDHVIMFDFPKNSIDYLHRTGRTARMGAKGRITSLVTKRDLLLADRIEEALRKNESVEGINLGSIWRDAAKPRPRQADTKQKSSKATPHNLKPRVIGRKTALAASRKSTPIKSFGRSASPKSTPIKSVGRSASQKSTPIKSVGRSASQKSTPIKSIGRSASQKSTPIKSVGRPATAKPRRPPSNSAIKSGPKSSPKAPRNARTGAAASAGSKLSIVGFRGRSSIVSRKQGLDEAE